MQYDFLKQSLLLTLQSIAVNSGKANDAEAKTKDINREYTFLKKQNFFETAAGSDGTQLAGGVAAATDPSLLIRCACCCC